MGWWSKISNAILVAIAGYEIGNNTQKPKESNDKEHWILVSVIIFMLILIICISKLNSYYKSYVNKKVNNNIV